MQNILIKKGLVLGILILFFCLNIQSTEIKVEQPTATLFYSGNTLYVGGGGSGNYSKIQNAIDNATNGDTVFVYDDSSPYYENIQINKSINLIGEDRNTTVIDASGKGHVIFIESNDINIQEFTLQNSSDHAIEIDKNFGFCTISNNIVFNNKDGIFMRYSCNNTIAGNLFSANKGITLTLLFNCNNNTISSNTLELNFRDGIYLLQSLGNNISENTIKNNNNGIVLHDSDLNFVFNNNISSKGYDGIQIRESSNNSIIGNNINYCDLHGIFIEEIPSNDNIIYNNNFIYNSKNANDKGINIWDNGYILGGNYWSDYNGTDNDGDGLGDTPYLIPGNNNEDRYPLMNPTVNYPPEKPSIDGPNSGKPGNKYEYTFNVTDPNDDSIMYLIDWGDNNTEWTEYGDSGVEIILKHNWNEKGEYTIRAKAKDINDAESDWAHFTVTMPRNKATLNLLLLRFLEQFPRVYSLFYLINER